MTASNNKLLFSWDDVEYLPDLQRLEFVLRYLPDEDLLRALNGKRGRGRDDYPVEAMWRALVAGVVFQHPSLAALIRELRRNPALLGLCGFNPLPRQGRPVVVREATAGAQAARLVPAPLHDSVPGDANFSRLLRNVVHLEEQQGLVSAMVDTLRKRLMEALPDRRDACRLTSLTLWMLSTPLGVSGDESIGLRAGAGCSGPSAASVVIKGQVPNPFHMFSPSVAGCHAEVSLSGGSL